MDIIDYKNILRNTELTHKQNVILNYSEYIKKLIVCMDTGTGKTFFSLARCQLTKLQKPKYKTLIVVPEVSSKDQWSEHIKNLTTLTYIDSTGSAEQLMKLFSAKQTADIVLVTYEALKKPIFTTFYVAYGDMFKTVIFDESKFVANFDSQTFKVAREIANKAECLFLLNATPSIYEPTELLAQLSVLRYEYEYKEMKYTYIDMEGGYRNLDRLKKLAGKQMICIPREDSINYIVSHYYTPTLESKITKLKELYEEGDLEFTRNIIYAHHNKNKDAVAELGITVIDGRNKECRTKLKEEFNNFRIHDICTNISVSLDLNCDCVVFFEYSPDWRQILGRAIRGFEKDRHLTVIWLIDDYDRFDRLVTRRKVLTQLAGKIDTTPIDITAPN